MRRHVEVHGVTWLMGKDDEDKQQAKADCRHDQEINRH
jgi:ssRNA-specific RNase YbeY (16S rRNA maturation enzyme)